MNKPLILVVEDDRSVNNLITTILKTHDYRYLTALNGAEAVLEASSHNPDIVLLDLGLPDTDGVDIIKKIRTWSNMPIIVISARNEDKDKIEALDAGADDYVTKPFSVEEFMKTWRQCEELVDQGLVRYIGMSNMTVPKLEAVLPLCRIKPAALEMELHPSFQQPELFDYAAAHDILPIGYCPLGSPSRPERDRTAEDVADSELPSVAAAAKAHGVHPANICLKWAVQRGQVPIPFSVKETQYQSNLTCVTEDPLTAEEMEAITKDDKNCRLIKGQVFLWEGARGWEDLWDLDGRITEKNV